MASQRAHDEGEGNATAGYQIEVNLAGFADSARVSAGCVKVPAFWELPNGVCAFHCRISFGKQRNTSGDQGRWSDVEQQINRGRKGRG